MIFNEMEYDPSEHIIDGKRVIHYCRDHWVKANRNIPARCGVSGSMSFVKKIGFVERQLASLESTVGSALGVKGLAELKSSLKKNLGEEFEFIFHSESSVNLECPASRCGSLNYHLYEKVRDHRFEIERQRMFLRPIMTMETVREYLGEVQFDIEDQPDDPDCPCPPSKKASGGGLARILIKKLSIVLPFSFEGGGMMSIAIGSNQILIESGNVQIDRRFLPGGWAALAGIPDEDTIVELDIQPLIFPDLNQPFFLRESDKSEGSEGDS